MTSTSVVEYKENANTYRIKCFCILELLPPARKNKMPVNK